MRKFFGTVLMIPGIVFGLICILLPIGSGFINSGDVFLFLMSLALIIIGAKLRKPKKLKTRKMPSAARSISNNANMPQSYNVNAEPTQTERKSDDWRNHF